MEVYLSKKKSRINTKKIVIHNLLKLRYDYQQKFEFLNYVFFIKSNTFYFVLSREKEKGHQYFRIKGD